MARPPGPLLWVHADDPARAPAVAALAAGLAEEGIGTLLTTPPEREAPPPDPRLAARSPAPPESPAAVRDFLDAWSPDLLLWIGGGLRPALVGLFEGPRLLLEGGQGPALSHGAGVPGLARAAHSLFERAFATDEEALGRLGFGALAAPLDPPPPVLPHDERERRALAEALGGRPVWLALDLPPEELPQVVLAHQRALRSAHRLLLIAAPREAEEAGALARGLLEAGLRTAQRAEGAEPGEGHAAYVAEGPGEAGLWLRLAPAVFLGGTILGPGGRHPFEAAALGSAILHGPRRAPHEAPWARLARAGAARLVRDGAEMGAALEGLLAPDRVAAMARGAWDVATAGAEVAALVAGLVRERIGRRGGGPRPEGRRAAGAP